MTVRFLPPDEERVPAPRDPSENFAKVVEMRSWLRPAEPEVAAAEAAAPADVDDDPAGAAVAADTSSVAADRRTGWGAAPADQSVDAVIEGEPGERDAIVTRVQFGAPRGETIVEPPSAWGRARAAADTADAADVSHGSPEPTSGTGTGTGGDEPAADRSAEAAAWADAWEREAAGEGAAGGYGNSRNYAEQDDSAGGGYSARGGRRTERETPEVRRARREARKAEREAQAVADASDRGPVYDDAVRLLARRARSSGELASELLALDHSANEVSIIVDEFIDSHYLDDIGLARSQCEKLRSSKGASKGQIRRKLRERKLPDHVIDEVCDELDSAEEFDLLREAAEKRAGQMKGLDRQTAERRLMGFLARRGWQGEAVTRAVREALDGAQGGRSARGPRFQ